MNTHQHCRKAKEVQPRVVEWRRYFHENPEPALKEFKTAKKVEETLKSFGIETRMMAGGIAVRGFLKGGKSRENHRPARRH